MNFDVDVFIHKRGAHHSLEPWTRLSLDKTLLFENLRLVIFPAYKDCWLYTFLVCTESQENSAATALWSIFEGYYRKRDGSVSGLTLILHLCHPFFGKENSDTRGNEIAPDLQLWSNCKPVLLLAAKFQASFPNTWESISEILACFMSKPQPLGELYLWKSEWGFR